MEYKCQIISMSRLVLSHNGFVMPLCESCEVKDCTNPIEKTKVSILGITKKIKMFNKGFESKIVIKCEGYIK